MESHLSPVLLVLEHCQCHWPALKNCKALVEIGWHLRKISDYPLAVEVAQKIFRVPPQASIELFAKEKLAVYQ